MNPELGDFFLMFPGTLISSMAHQSQHSLILVHVLELELKNTIPGDWDCRVAEISLWSQVNLKQGSAADLWLVHREASGHLYIPNPRASIMPD